MIVVNNVGSVDEEPSWRNHWIGRVRWGLLLVLLIFIYGSHAPLISLTKIDGEVPFSSSSCVVLIEVCKLLVSFAALGATRNLSSLKSATSMATLVPYSIPALLYAFNNNLVVSMQAHMDPSSFQVLSNLKIVSTALLYTSCLGKRLRRAQWLAVGLLVGAGVCHSYFSLDQGSLEDYTRLRVTSLGLFLVLLYCFVSGLAAVYTERVLKTQRLPLSLQNLFLYVFGVGINVVSHVSVSDGQRGFLEGFSGVVWIIIAGQTVNGLLMSVIMKHGTGITRLFVISSAMLVNGLLSWGILGIHLTPRFLFPVLLVGWAAYLYYR